MKADAAQQRRLTELAASDAELSRLAHRRGHPPEQQEREELQARHRQVGDQIGVLAIALEDLDAQVTKLDSDVSAVRQREDRDRSLLDAGSGNAKELTELQHELDTLQRRQSTLEDAELELMERREELQAQQAKTQADADAIAARVTEIERRQHETVAEIEAAEQQEQQRRGVLVAELDTTLLEAYERQRRSGGPGAGLLQGNKCGACRIELNRGELARISSAGADDVLRCPECGAILVRP